MRTELTIQAGTKLVSARQLALETWAAANPAEYRSPNAKESFMVELRFPGLLVDLVTGA